MPDIIHIVALSKNGYIGVNDKLPFDLPEDLLNFKSLTADSLICMGFNTFKSIADNYAKKGQPFLKGRKVSVICSSAQKATERTVAYKEFDNVLFLPVNIFNQILSRNRQPVLLVGGCKLYSMYRPTLIVATHVDMDVTVPVLTQPVDGSVTTQPVVVDKNIKYPYFDKLSTEYFGMSFSQQTSSTGLSYKYTVYLGK